VHEILENLRPGQRVLDLGSNAGSFDSSLGQFIAIRADLDHPSGSVPNFAQADAAHLPFANGTFDGVISNHSLEHFGDLAGSLAEIGRVLKPRGALYIAVPDASTFCDRLYRWLARGGGHVNPFTSAQDLAGMIERATHLRHVETRTLCTSLSYLNHKNFRGYRPKRLLLAGNGTEISLHAFTYYARLSDRLFGTRLSVYGWALYFGSFAVPVDTDVWSNVCIRCGSGAQSGWLRAQNLVRRRFLMRIYRCPNCGTTNLFSEDRHYGHFSITTAGTAPAAPVPGPNPQKTNPQSQGYN
jgi:SAM-dependent methyltransferase